MRARAHWRVSLITGVIAGLLFAVPAMLAAWDHNPQGVFHDEDGINWIGWLTVGLSWFIAVGLFVTLVLRVLFLLDRADRQAP